MHTAQRTVLAAVTAAAQQHGATVYEDGTQGVGMYGSTAVILTVYSTVLAQLGAEQVQGLEQLAAADGTVDMSVDFVYEGQDMYLTTCYES